MTSKKKTYELTVPVESVNGTQLWRVKAESPKDAIARFKKGEGDCIGEEIEVTSLGEVSVSDVQEVEDLPPIDVEPDPFDWSKKSDEEIVAAGLELARRFYKAHGYEVPVGYKFYEARHPQEQGMWELAVMAFEELTGTDLNDALDNIGE